MSQAPEGCSGYLVGTGDALCQQDNFHADGCKPEYLGTGGKDADGEFFLPDKEPVQKGTGDDAR